MGLSAVVEVHVRSPEPDVWLSIGEPNVDGVRETALDGWVVVRVGDASIDIVGDETDFGRDLARQPLLFRIAGLDGSVGFGGLAWRMWWVWRVGAERGRGGTADANNRNRARGTGIPVSPSPMSPTR